MRGLTYQAMTDPDAVAKAQAAWRHEEQRATDILAARIRLMLLEADADLSNPNGSRIWVEAERDGHTFRSDV